MAKPASDRIVRDRTGRRQGGGYYLPLSGDTLIVPLLEEVAVVEKRLVLREELRIRRRRSEERAPQRVALRAEEAQVERLDPGEAAAAAEGRGSRRRVAVEMRRAGGS